MLLVLVIAATIGILVFGERARALVSQKKPAATNPPNLSFKQYCLNNKQILVFNGGGAMWNIDQAGRPILCGELQEVGPIVPEKKAAE